ncbi:hypothetical protein D6833_03740 [Candidatus Parcubacteria bacterium]|nr:MAG: hypothetical protein D6833_03740 [Candidatus Parcubacteria bacterium]
MKDVELKTHVSEKVHDDFLLLVRAYGFNTKSELLRYLIERELYGVVPHLQITAPGAGMAGKESGL